MGGLGVILGSRRRSKIFMFLLVFFFYIFLCIRGFGRLGALIFFCLLARVVNTNVLVLILFFCSKPDR